MFDTSLRRQSLSPPKLFAVHWTLCQKTKKQRVIFDRRQAFRTHLSAPAWHDNVANESSFPANFRISLLENYEDGVGEIFALNTDLLRGRVCLSADLLTGRAGCDVCNDVSQWRLEINVIDFKFVGTYPT